jgi:hypothetical protein
MIIASASTNRQDNAPQVGPPRRRLRMRMRIYDGSARKQRRSWRPHSESLEERQLLSSVVSHHSGLGLATLSSASGSGKSVAAAIHVSRVSATGHRVAASHDGAIVSSAATRQNTPPKVTRKASAKLSPATGSTMTLAAMGTDDGGAANLKYTWTATALPPGAAVPTFSANGSNAAKNTMTALNAAGTYRFTVSIADAAGLMAASSVSVAVKPALTSRVVLQ